MYYETCILGEHIQWGNKYTNMGVLLYPKFIILLR